MMKKKLCPFIALYCVIFLSQILPPLYSYPRPKGSIIRPINLHDTAVQTKTDVENYYSALSSTDTIKINAALQTLESVKTTLAKAYMGALIMKKSELVKSPGKKLSLFKEGKSFLEEAIGKENQNAEFRFLRLVIQENCPSFLKYHAKIKEDAVMVKKEYAKFSAEATQAVKDYAKTSAALKSVE